MANRWEKWLGFLAKDFRWDEFSNPSTTRYIGISQQSQFIIKGELMRSKRIVLKATILFFGALNMCQIWAIVANPILSRGKTVYTSSGTVTYLTDDKFGSPSWTAGDNSWLAINVGANYSKIFVNWDVPYTNWFDSTTGAAAGLKTCGGPSDIGPVDYTFQTSSNSTNGSDGTWTTVATITGNKLTSRGQLIDFTNASWVKMNITKGGGSLDEFEVFDMSNNGTDIWFFPGTSITEMTYKSEPPPENFADLVHAAHPSFNPVMIRGGIGCILSVYLSTFISYYIDMTRGAKYWAIEMGTNDAWGGGTSGLAAFTQNMQIVIDSCKAAGIQPIIQRLLATNSSVAGWQVNYAFEEAIDSLTAKNKLIPGPDPYSYFLAHPSQHISDGIHPNDSGAAAIQSLWAQKMDSLYTVTTAVQSGGESVMTRSARSFSLSYANNKIEIHALSAGVLRIFSINGALLKSMNIPVAGSYHLASVSGCRIGQFTSIDRNVETMPIVFH